MIKILLFKREKNILNFSICMVCDLLLKNCIHDILRHKNKKILP